MPKNGYTLIELLIVLSIMAILGVMAFVNFKDFSQDQILNKAVGDLQSLLRLAQSNATSGVTCGGNGVAFWGVKFTDQTTLDLVCGTSSPPDASQKRLILENVTVSAIQCSPPDSTCPPAGAVFSSRTVSFAPISGSVTFTTCSANDSTLMVALKKTNGSKCFTISKGGAIDIQ